MQEAAGGGQGLRIPGARVLIPAVLLSGLESLTVAC